MMMGGSDEPCAVCRLTWNGEISNESNMSHNSKLYPIIKEKLGIPGDRTTIAYHEIDRANIAKNGITKQNLMAPLNKYITNFKSKKMLAIR